MSRVWFIPKRIGSVLGRNGFRLDPVTNYFYIVFFPVGSDRIRSGLVFAYGVRVVNELTVLTGLINGLTMNRS